MDPGAYIAIVEIAGRVGLRLARFLNDSRHAGRTRNQLHAKVTSLHGLLAAVEAATSSRKSQLHDKPVGDDEGKILYLLRAALERCESTVDKMYEKLQWLRGGEKDPKWHERAILQVRIDYQTSDIAKLEGELHSNTTAIQLLFSCLSPFMHEETLTAIHNSSRRTEENFADILAALDLLVQGPYQSALGDATPIRFEAEDKNLQEETLAAIRNISKRTEKNFADILAILDLLVQGPHQSSLRDATSMHFEAEDKPRSINDGVAEDISKDPTSYSTQIPPDLSALAVKPQVAPSNSTSHGCEQPAEARPSTDASQSAKVSQNSTVNSSQVCLLSNPTTSTEQSFDSAATRNLLTVAHDGDGDDAPMTEHLLKTGANIEYIDAESGFTPLLVAARCKRTEVCRKLLNNSHSSANVHAKDEEGRNVLHIALFGSGKVDLIELLVAHGANINEPDNELRTPLHYCVMYNRKQAAQHLLAKDAAKEVVDRAEETPLSLAFRSQKTELVEMLLAAGAIVHDKNLSRTSEGIRFMVADHQAGTKNKSRITRRSSHSSQRSRIGRLILPQRS